VRRGAAHRTGRRPPAAFVEPREQPSASVSVLRRCQAAARKRIRAWSARAATRSGPSTAGRVRSMLGSRRAGTTGTRSMTTLPQGLGRRERPRPAPSPRLGRAGPARPDSPRSPQRAAWGRADNGHATAVQTHRAEGGPIVLGVDHEHPTGTDHQVVEGRRGRGQPQVGHGQGRAQLPARQRRTGAGSGAAGRTRRRLQRPATLLSPLISAPPASRGCWLLEVGCSQFRVYP
jgi:hypothetical protein